MYAPREKTQYTKDLQNRYNEYMSGIYSRPVGSCYKTITSQRYSDTEDNDTQEGLHTIESALQPVMPAHLTNIGT